MPLIDIPTTVNALVTYFALGGTALAVEIVTTMVNKVSLTVEEFMKLKDDLQRIPKVAEQVKALQQNTQDQDLQVRLSEILTEKMAQYPGFQQNVEVHGDIKADRGSVAGGIISGNTRINNTFNND